MPTTKPKLRYYHATADESRRIREGTQTVIVMPVKCEIPADVADVYYGSDVGHDAIYFTTKRRTFGQLPKSRSPFGRVGDVFGVRERNRSQGIGQSNRVLEAERLRVEAATTYCRVVSVNVKRVQDLGLDYIAAGEAPPPVCYSSNPNDYKAWFSKDWDRRHPKHKWNDNRWVWIVGVRYEMQ